MAAFTSIDCKMWNNSILLNIAFPVMYIYAQNIRIFYQALFSGMLRQEPVV